MRGLLSRRGLTGVVKGHRPIVIVQEPTAQLAGRAAVDCKAAGKRAHLDQRRTGQERVLGGGGFQPGEEEHNGSK